MLHMHNCNPAHATLLTATHSEAVMFNNMPKVAKLRLQGHSLPTQKANRQGRRHIRAMFGCTTMRLVQKVLSLISKTIKNSE